VVYIILIYSEMVKTTKINHEFLLNFGKLEAE